MENKKNECLAAVYKGDAQSLGQLLKEVTLFEKKQIRLTENDEKILRQILAIFKQFKSDLSDAVDQDILDTIKALKKRLAKMTGKQSRSVEYMNLSQWEQKLGLNTDQMALVFKTAMTFQLSSGCSHYCRRCNEWALPGVRSHFTYKTVLSILDRMAAQGNDEISLYGASDPLDWQEGTLSILDIIRHIQTLPLDYSLLSKVPRGKEKLLTDLLKQGANISVSVTAKNQQRIQKIEAKTVHPLYKQHDSEDLMIPAGLDEDFKTVKPSITDGYGTEISPAGAFIIIPTFTSALHPFGHKKIAVTPDTCFFPVKKTGRHALLVDYFKPLKGYDLDLKPAFLYSLLDVQVESLILDSGQDQLTPPGMTSFKEFLSIFDEPARRRREKMTPSILKRLKTKHVRHTSFKQLSEHEQQIYLKKIKRHLQLCKKEFCIEFKFYAFSYFLDAIHTYIQKNPLKRRILCFLIKEQVKDFLEFKEKMAAVPVEENLLNPALDDFDLFRYYTVCLLTQIKNREILEFINCHRACYDSVTDMFVSAGNDH